MAERVLVDTSGWISFLRKGRGRGPVSDRVGELVQQDRAVVAGPVLAELLQGARGQREIGEIENLGQVVAYAEIERPDWESAGRTLRGLREKGITIPIVDGVLAALAARNGWSLLSEDDDFDHLQVKRLKV